MASDLSSVCTDDNEIFDEKEEGEISLEDVSSSEESHPHYRLGFRNGGCPNCMSLQQCSPWCNYARILRRRLHRKQDGDHGKENRRNVKDSSGTIGKQHVTSTLQEKNDDEDLVPISSDSDMEVVGLPGNSKHVASRTSPKSSKVRKKKKKKRNQHGPITTGRLEEASGNVETYDLVDEPAVKVVHASRSHHRDSLSPRYNVGMTSLVEKTLMRSPSRRYRTGRNVKSRSPPRRSRSPVLNHANPMVRRLSRKLRSSRRTSSRSPVRFELSREPRDSAASPAHVDMYASKLLKKVRHLESVGTFSSKNKCSRSKEHSSLKEKLDNMMKNKETIVRGDKKKLANKESGHLVENNNVDRRIQQDEGKSKEDEDEDIELLRRLALETKQKKAESKHEEGTKSGNDTAPRIEANLSDDNDSEALELRMIALHSAVMNKHRNRVERGFGSRKNRTGNKAGNESPFSLSFLDAIPIPDELSDNGAQSPIPKSPVHNDETNNPEDMELDTDVEREKDSMPYSPTDDLTARRINVDEELPVQVPREILSNETAQNLSTEMKNSEDRKDLVSLGTFVDTPRSPSISAVISTSLISENIRTDTTKVTSMSHSPERSGYTSGESLTNYIDNPNAPYSPSKPVEASKIDYVSSPSSKSIINIETPYSPTDAPIYDPELTHFSPDTNVAASKNCENSETSKNSHENSTWTGETGETNLVPMMFNMSMNEAEIPDANTSKTIATRSEQCPLNIPANFFSQDDESIKFYEAIIDELPEIDLDGSPLVPVSKESSNLDIAMPINSGFASLSNEPLYLQGLPDVTRDDNKIPTLVNKTLVPAAILKTNKQLQQPLPPKRLENPVEPSFKSAEMRPVSELEIAGLNATKTFKPIKLCPILKKPQVMMASAAAFNSSFGDDLPLAVETNKEILNNPIANVIKDATDKLDISIKPTSVTSSATENSQNSDKSAKIVESRRKNTLKNDKSEPSSTGKSKSPKKVKAKSVDKYISRLSLERTKETNNKTPRRASSSPAIDERASRRRKLDNQTTAFDSPLIRSKKATQKNLIESSSEANSGKTVPKKKRTRRGGRNRRARYNVEKPSILEKRRSSEGAEKGIGSSTETQENVNNSIEINRSKDSETMKKTKKNDALADAKPTTEELKNPVAEQPKESKKSEEVEKSRRLSLDEDEEALRALLLASLPKRAKIVDVTPETANPIVKMTGLTDTTPAHPSLEKSSEEVDKVVGNSDSSTVFLAPTLPLPSSQSSSSASSMPPEKIDPPIDPSKNIAVAKNILVTETNSNLSSSSSLTSSPLTPRKRTSSVVLKNPPKKIAKKALPALASTRVVNNAKKYQNAMLQKRLNLQRATTSYNAATGSRNITLNNIKTYENARPASPKLTNSSSKTHRLVISLESDTDSDAELSNQETNSPLKSSDTSTAKQKPLSIPTTDFEKSLERFLKDQRKKTESNTATASTTSSTVTTNVTKSPAPSNSAVKDLGIYNTPLAVRRHLPVSQQEEYRRLKQQIMERERQMFQKNIDNGMNSQIMNVRSPCTPPGPLSPASPIAATLLAKSHTQRISTHLPGTTVGSGREKFPDKMEENGGLSNVNKVVKPPTETYKKTTLSSVAETAKVTPRTANVSRNPATTSTPKSLNENTQFPSTSKVSTNIITGKISLQSKQKENVGNVPKSKDLSVSSRIKMTSSTSLAGSIPASGTTIGHNSFVGSLKGTEMLTIQIPNDKIQTDRSTLSSDSIKNNTNLTENIEALTGSRNNGALRVLSTDQLNNRFIKIQVERGPAGRRVTVAPTTSDSSASKTLPVSSDMQIEKTVICDNRLSFNENNAMRRNEGSFSNRNFEKDQQSENSLNKSDASTLVLSENERNPSNLSIASTLILSNDHLRTHENLESTRFNDIQSSDTSITKQTKIQLKEVWEKIRMDVKNELKILETLSADEQNKFLQETQENLVAKRNMVLEDLTEMSRYLRQWDFEREIQTKLVAEVRRLREQLKAAEDRLDEQRRQMNDMGPRVTRTHEKINHGRRECYKLSRICQGLGNRVIGPNYKIPNTNARLLNEQLKEVAVHTRQLTKKKVSTLNNSLNSSGDVTFSSAMADVTSIEAENSITSLNETVNRIDAPSTPMSETDNEDDVNEDHEPTRENEVSVGESNDPVPELEKEGSMDSFSECPHEGELKPRIEEIEESKLAEINNEGNEQTSCSTEINHAENEIPNVSEINAPSKETENSINLEMNVTSDETEVENLPKSNTSPSEINALNVPETNVLSKETNSHQLAELNKNMLSFDTVANNELEATTSTTINSEINLISLAPKVSARHRTEDQLSIPGTSRSVSPALSLPNDSRNTGKRRHSSYNSVLAHFKTTRNVNPNGILCPYELMGTCNDGDCQYYHLDPARQCQ